jgi:hypothetical protein
MKNYNSDNDTITLNTLYYILFGDFDARTLFNQLSFYAINLSAGPVVFTL